MNNIYYLESEKLSAFLSALRTNYKVFVPFANSLEPDKADYSWRRLSEGQAVTYNAWRTVEPFKAFFTRPLEKVADYFTAEKNITDISEKTVVFGVKNCDIIGHKVQDFVFLEGVDVDSLYRLRRENTFIISGDRTDFKEVCHCLAWDILPYPSQGFDLNFSPLNDGYLVETGTERAEDLIARHRGYFTPAKETKIAARKSKRESLVDRLKRHLLPQNLVSKNIVQKLVKEGFSADTWKQFMLTCVECGGCNLICDTCHCFLLADKKEGNQNKKVRVWDSCLYKNYARVAGGANPLKLRAQRLRNRFVKKFDFFVDNLGMPACCGCGRCIEVCPGKIDIREVLKDLSKKIAVK